MSNKPATATIPTASPKLDSKDKKPPKRRDSSKRVSDDLKRSISKELKVPKERRTSRSSSPPPDRSSSRKSSSKLGLKEKKPKKKKKLKKVLSDPSLHRRSVEIAMDSASYANASSGTLPLHSDSTHSEASNKKKIKRRRSEKTSRKSLQDAIAVAAFIEKKDLEGSSEHTESTKTSDSTGSTKDNSDKSVTTKKSSKKPLEKSASKKGLKNGKSSSFSVPLTEAKKSPKLTSPKSPGAVRNRVLSFESIHGKSIHKPKTRRTSGNGTGVEKGFETLAPPSPQQQHATFSSPVSAGTKKKSVLKAKREKQEQERRASMGKSTTSETSSTASKNKEDYIHEVLEIVNSTHIPKSKSSSSTSSVRNKSNNADDSDDEFIDPDECSSQSSSCSIVSDGSYEKDDLLSMTSEQSDEYLSTPGSLLNGNPSFGEHSFTIDADHELSPTKHSPTNAVLDMISPSDGVTPLQSSSRDGSFKDSLMEAMASSMSALSEVNEDESPYSSPVASSRKKMPKKTLLKIPETMPNYGGGGRAPRRIVPKRAKSDITSLSSIGRLTKNLLEVRLPGRKTVTRQRSLTFNEKVRVKRIPCQAQICEGDTSDLWFQPQEYDAIKRKTMALIRAVQDDQTGGVTYCTRGLERYFSVDAVQVKRNDAWDSVLDEQDAQRSNSESFSAERLSRAYSQTTRNSVQEAMERGKLDEDAIARYTRKMRQTLRRTYSNAV